MEDFKKNIKESMESAEALTSTVNRLYIKIGDLKKQQADLVASGLDTTRYYKSIVQITEGYRNVLDKTSDRLSQMNARVHDQIQVLVSARERIEVWSKAWDVSKSRIEGLTEKIGSLSDKLGDSAKGFRPFADNLKTAVSVITPFKTAIAKANQAYTEYKQSVSSGNSKFEALKNIFPALSKGAEEGTSKFKGLRIALAETGIGLIVLAVAAFIEKLKTMKPVMDQINAVTAAIGATMGAFANAITGLFTDPINTIKNFGSTMANTAKDAYQLSLAQDKLKTALSSQEVANEKIKNQVDLLKQQADNVKLSTKERETALNAAHSLDEKYFKSNGDLAKAAMNNAIKDAQIKGNLQTNELKNLRTRGTEYARVLLEDGRITQEQFDTIKQTDLDLIKLRKEHADNFKEYLNAQQKIQDEQKAKDEEAKAERDKKAKEVAEQRRAELQKKLDDEKQFNKEAAAERTASAARMAEAALSGFAKEIQATDAHFQELKNKYAKNKATVEQLERERVATLQQINDKFSKEEIGKLDEYQKQLKQIAVDNIQDATERSLAALQLETKEKTDEMDKRSFGIVNIIAQQQQQIALLIRDGKYEEAAILKSSIENQMKMLDAAGKLKQDLLQKQKKKEQDILQSNADATEKEQEDELTGSIQQNEEGGHHIKALQQQRKLLDMQEKAAIESAKRQGETTSKIELDFARKKAALEEQLTNAKIHAGDKYIDAVLKNSNKDSAIYKAAFLAKKATSVADTIISTKQAVLESLKAYSGIPFIGQALGIAQAAFMAAQGASSIAAIIKQKPGFASGGRFISDGRGALLAGYSRTDDTNAYLRSGEAVVVSEAMRNPWARNLVSAINVAHGGRDFSVPSSTYGYAIGGIYTDGGNANRYYNQPVNDIKEMANTLAYQMINNFPPVYVDVKDINNQQSILAQTVNRVNL